MQEPQIDPYKLNEVLEQILDGITAVRERSNSASPEFQILMNNYLTKANESERNQARLEESIERVNIKDHEVKKIHSEKEELEERIKSFQQANEMLKQDHDKEIKAIREELAEIKQAKEKLENESDIRFEEELRQSTTELNKQINFYREQLTDSQSEIEKVSQKLEDAQRYEKELRDLKTKVMEEQEKIRDEIIEVTKRSSQAEQFHQEEKDRFIKQIRQLESDLDESRNQSKLQERELDYKNALLDQAMKKPQAVISSAQIQQEVQPDINIQPQQPESTEGIRYPQFSKQEDISETLESDKETVKEQVGGIWSKLSS